MEPRPLQIEPQRLLEGAGGPPSSGRGVVLLISGPQFADDASVSTDDPRLSLSTPQISSDGQWLAVQAWLDVDPSLSFGETATVSVSIDVGDGEISEVPIVVDGLDELTLAGPVDGATLAPMYSQVVTSETTTFVGDAPIHLTATNLIRIQHPIIASGVGLAPGPGGQAGGKGGVDGEGLRGGAAGEMRDTGCAGGGGGAGAQMSGEAGGRGATGGLAGPATPRRPNDADRLAGHGGGGGGDRRETIGGSGGGGGGSVWLAAAALAIEASID
ncbi:MAG: hypothetical protein AAFN74_25310, partial [Myxococcota bacterium]